MKLRGNVEIPISDDNNANPIVPFFILDGLDVPECLKWSNTKGWHVLTVSVIVSSLQNNINFVIQSLDGVTEIILVTGVFSCLLLPRPT